jgi:uncharacterized membrane protein
MLPFVLHMMNPPFVRLNYSLALLHYGYLFKLLLKPTRWIAVYAMQSLQILWQLISMKFLVLMGVWLRRSWLQNLIKCKMDRLGSSIVILHGKKHFVKSVVLYLWSWCTSLLVLILSQRFNSILRLILNWESWLFRKLKEFNRWFSFASSKK